MIKMEKPQATEPLVDQPILILTKTSFISCPMQTATAFGNISSDFKVWDKTFIRDNTCDKSIWVEAEKLLGTLEGVAPPWRDIIYGVRPAGR